MSPLTLTNLAYTLLMLVIVSAAGCGSLLKSKKDEEENERKLQKLLVAPPPPDLIGIATVPHGLNFVAIEGIAAINGLPGTGGPIAPSYFRDAMLEEMKKNDVKNPQAFLERPETAVVRVQGIIGPGARRGDSIDIRIVSPAESDAKDLHGGWLLETRLRQQQRLAGAVRKSEVLAVGTGPVLVRADFETEDDATLNLQGLVLGGGRVQQERKLGLVIRPEFQHVKIASQFAGAINSRFYFYDGTSRTGIAKAVEDDFIEVQVHPRYRRNIHRLMAVIAMVSPTGESSETQLLLTELGKRLNDPATAADAALQLEAIGESAIPTLSSVLAHPNSEVRFYAAQALAYLDRRESIEPLTQAIRQEPAFRHPALLALEGIDNRSALEALISLMDEASFETRYGAMRSIRRRSDRDTALRSMAMGDSYRFYQVPSTAPPFIAVSLTDAPELVLFGDAPPLMVKDFIMAPNGIVIRPSESVTGELRVSRFVPGQEDKRADVPPTVEGMLTGIAMVGGGYGEAIAALRIAKTNAQLECGLAIDPLPQAMRTYHREDEPTLSDPAALPPEDVQMTSEEPEEDKKSFWRINK